MWYRLYRRVSQVYHMLAALEKEADGFRTPIDTSNHPSFGARSRPRTYNNPQLRPWSLVYLIRGGQQTRTGDRRCVSRLVESQTSILFPIDGFCLRDETLFGRSQCKERFFLVFQPSTRLGYLSGSSEGEGAAAHGLA